MLGQGRQSRCNLVEGQSHRLGGADRGNATQSRTVIAALVAITANAQTIQGRVVGISDGDTITVRDASRTQHAVRYARDLSYQDTIRGIAAAQESVPCKRS